MKPGDKVVCIDSEPSCPVKVGQTYTVRRYGTYRRLTGERPEVELPGNPKAVILEEHPDDIYRETRFRLL